MPLLLYNTLTRRKEPFEPLESGRVKMYVCGPTVYDKAHVGHGMSSLVFDMIRRYLERKGFQVDHVMNYTDVDDKVIDRARQLGEDPLELANRYIAEYERHLEALNVLPARAYPRVSSEIEHVVRLVDALVEQGCAYELEGDVYFRVSRDDDYGKLSGRKLDEMRAGARLEVDKRKEDPADFALWKSAKPGEPAWESPWGRGRPGWHIECSAMSLQYLGEQIDIHGGGNDLIFPHHENEIAQTESLTRKPFARYWVHNGMMQMAGEDMSKSTGNVYTIESFLAEHEPDALRMLILNSHYRSPLVFNEEVVAQAESALERLRSALRPPSPTPEATPEAEAKLGQEVGRARTGFDAAMEDDFNTPRALSHLFELARAINQGRDIGLRAGPLGEAQALLEELAGVLGLRLSVEAPSKELVAPFVELLIEVRAHLRRSEQWELSDWIRDRLAEQGVVVEDTKEGTSWSIRP